MEDMKPVAHLVWLQGRRGPDDVEDYYEVARPGDKCVDGSDPFPVYAQPSIPTEAMVEAAALAIIAAKAPTVANDENWPETVKHYRAMCAKWPEYAAANSLVTDSFREARIALSAALALPGQVREIAIKPLETAEPVAWFMHLWNEADEKIKSDVRWGQPTVEDIERAEHNGHDVEYLYDVPPAFALPLPVQESGEKSERLQVGWAYNDTRWDGDRWHVCGLNSKPRSFEGRRVEPVYLSPSPSIPEEKGTAESVREGLVDTIKEWGRWHHLNEMTIAAGKTPSDSEIDIEVIAWNKIKRALAATASEGSADV